ncbi:hypothetical protein CJF42_20590 [Pseudoalteromonas sp. NBT06-2]|uniref:type II secretion system F family protein n=1 Tax=Pseudoalteromonas sp. NBT06-2 TaxID=2025950 RepID=UPI000BA7D293|nr:type II secretion system F family protein [Pseudoalteromonas sp. NBT06-2]PAJ72553.1 hypothetical protein CJF42_20590 [Pseudoalteromonas sp. NBT06-2]
MLALFVLLLLLLCFLTAVLIKLAKQQNKIDERLTRYLISGVVTDNKTEKMQLFDLKKHKSGWQFLLYSYQQKLLAVASKKSLIKFLVVALVFFFPLYYMTEQLILVWQIFAVITSYIIGSYLALKRLIKNQRIVFEESFPQAIATISRAVSAGVAVPAAMAHVTEDIAGPVAQEFQRITDQLAIGITLEDALADASLRVGLPSFKFFTVTLLLNQNSGGQLTFVLHQLMANLHERTALQKKLLSMTAEPRTSAKIIAALPPLFLLLFWFQAPHIFDYLLYQSAGQWVSIYAALSIVTGLLVINKMTKITH